MTTTKKLLVLLALGLGACRADNRSSIEILGRAAPSSATACDYAPGGEFDLTPAILDVGAAYGGFLRYELPLYVNSLLADPTSATSGTVPSAKAWRFDGARVRVNPADHLGDLQASPTLLPVEAENTIPGDGQVIEVNGSTVLRVDVISQQLGTVLQSRAVANQSQRIVLGISLLGHTLDGAELNTGEWFYSLEVCSGCLTCTGCTGSTPICAAPALPASSCGGPGQDFPTVCVTPAP